MRVREREGKREREKTTGRQAKAVGQAQLQLRRATRDACVGALAVVMPVVVCVCSTSVLLVFVQQVFNKKLLNNLCSLFALLAAARRSRKVRQRGTERERER